MSILSWTSADEVKLGYVDATVKQPCLWSWMEQCVTINNVKNVLLNCVWNHGSVKMYPKGHIRKVLRAWRIENLGAHFFVYANTGLCTRHARFQFCACELPVCAHVYADCVHHCVMWLCTLWKYFLSVVLSYLILH